MSMHAHHCFFFRIFSPGPFCFLRELGTSPPCVFIALWMLRHTVRQRVSVYKNYKGFRWIKSLWQGNKLSNSFWVTLNNTTKKGPLKPWLSLNPLTPPSGTNTSTSSRLALFLPRYVRFFSSFELDADWGFFKLFSLLFSFLFLFSLAVSTFLPVPLLLFYCLNIHEHCKTHMLHLTSTPCY